MTLHAWCRPTHESYGRGEEWMLKFAGSDADPKRVISADVGYQLPSRCPEASQRMSPTSLTHPSHTATKPIKPIKPTNQSINQSMKQPCTCTKAGVWHPHVHSPAALQLPCLSRNQQRMAGHPNPSCLFPGKGHARHFRIFFSSSSSRSSAQQENQAP